ncbi:MAG: PQQ-binding-like beta-propeller repeat protein [Haloplanus sp.]
MPSIDRRTFLGTLAVGAGVGLAGCSSSCPDSESPTPDAVFGAGEAGSGFQRLPGGAWPAPRFDAANTGYAPSRRAPTDTPTLRWRTTLPAPSVEDTAADVSSPTVADGRVYLTTGAGAFAVALRDGTDRWRNTDLTPATAGPTVGYERELAPPVVGDGVVYVATTDGVAALRTDDGTVAWRYTDAAATGTPALADGALFVPTDGGLVALDAADGRERWADGAGAETALPAVAEGTVVVAGEELTALDAATGDTRWTSPVRPEFYPVVADGTVYLGTYEGVVGVALADGTERWTVDRGSGRTFSAPVVTPETLYAVERPGEAGDATFALDRTGDGPPSPRWCSYVGEGAVTAATEGHAFALQNGGNDRSPPVRLVAFTERFGEAAWGFASAERLVPPAVLDGGVVTANRFGTVVAFGGG